MSEPRKPLALVAAMAKNHVIGRGNGIPWDLPEDRKHFVRATKNRTIIMGRATWDSIGKPLPKRRNIVVTRQRDLQLEGAEVVHSLSAAIDLARQTDAEPLIIGGGQLYQEALPLATRIDLTVLDLEVPGDTYFPRLDTNEWRCSSETRIEGATQYIWERAIH